MTAHRWEQVRLGLGIGGGVLAAALLLPLTLPVVLGRDWR